MVSIVVSYSVGLLTCACSRGVCLLTWRKLVAISETGVRWFDWWPSWDGGLIASSPPGLATDDVCAIVAGVDRSADVDRCLRWVEWLLISAHFGYHIFESITVHTMVTFCNFIPQRNYGRSPYCHGLFGETCGVQLIHYVVQWTHQLSFKE